MNWSIIDIGQIKHVSGRDVSDYSRRFGVRCPLTQCLFILISPRLSSSLLLTFSLCLYLTYLFTPLDKL